MIKAQVIMSLIVDAEVTLSTMYMRKHLYAYNPGAKSPDILNQI